MIQKQQFINKLRELRYTFKEQLKRVEVWRKIGGTHMVFVPRRDQLSEEWVRSTLRQCGSTESEIQSFIASAKS